MLLSYSCLLRFFSIKWRLLYLHLLRKISDILASLIKPNIRQPRLTFIKENIRQPSALLLRPISDILARIKINLNCIFIN